MAFADETSGAGTFRYGKSRTGKPMEYPKGFKSFEILGSTNDVFDIWFATSVSLITIMLNNVRQIDEIKFEKKKTAILALLEVFKEQILNI